MIQPFFKVKSVLKDLIVSRGHHSNDILLLQSKDVIKDSTVTIMTGKCMYNCTCCN